MSYNVIWLPAAEDELAELWLDASLRAAITRASNDLDKQLRRDAPNAGESRSQDFRIVFELPLVASVWVQPGGREVRVMHVWLA